jgi:hypothetical protein
MHIRSLLERSWFLPLLICLIVVVYQAFLIPRTGMTWDEPSSFFFGQANVRFWQTLDSRYVQDFKNPALFSSDPIQYIYGEDVYPPFALMMFSWVAYLLSQSTGLISLFHAYHLGEVLYSLPGILAFYGICRLIGLKRVVAFLTTLAFVTYPTISNQLRSDAKDVPLMSMIVLTVYLLLRWVVAVKRSQPARYLWGIITAISFGLTMGTKVSAGIMVPIVVVYLVGLLILSRQFRQGMKPWLLRVFELASFGLVALGVFVLSWPWLWPDIPGRLVQVWDFFKVVGRGMPVLYFGSVYQAGVNLPWHYPIGILLSQTSPLIWPVVLIGVLFAGYRILAKRDIVAWFAIIWLLIGMGRFFVPGVLIYAKVRHFIDAIPAIFIFLGYGIFFLQSIVGKWRIKSIQFRYLSFMAIGVVLLHQVLILLTHAPYEATYFSQFAGGTKTVADKHLFDIEYWASAVKEGMEAVDRLSSEPTTVYACTMGHLALFYETAKTQVKGSPWESQYILIPNSYSWFGGPAEHAKVHHDLVYTVRANGADLLWVYKFREPAFWNCGYETTMNYTL